MSNDKCTVGVKALERIRGLEGEYERIDQRMVRVENAVAKLPWMMITMVLTLIGVIVTMVGVLVG